MKIYYILLQITWTQAIYNTENFRELIQLICHDTWSISNRFEMIPIYSSLASETVLCKFGNNKIKIMYYYCFNHHFIRILFGWYRADIDAYLYCICVCGMNAGLRL